MLQRKQSSESLAANTKVEMLTSDLAQMQARDAHRPGYVYRGVGFDYSRLTAVESRMARALRFRRLRRDKTHLDSMNSRLYS